MSHARVALLASILLLDSAAAAAQQAAAPPTRTLEFTGLVLVNGFWNDNFTDNADVPHFVLAVPPANAVREGGVGATARQSRLGLTLTQSQVLGATFTGEVDVDFYGGQLANGGRTSPVLRLRRLVARLNWPRGEWLVGQETQLVAEINPRSLASIGTPGFVAAGNLWFWMPQIRGTYEIGSTVRFAVAGAVIAPMTGAAQGSFNTALDSAEQSGRPFLQGRARVSWGAADDASELGVGYHMGWFAETDSTLTTNRALVVSGRIKLGLAEMRGEWYDGHGLGVLGGGGIGRNFSTVIPGDPLNDQGGWFQLNLRPRSTIEFGGGCGFDQPDEAQLDPADPLERLSNVACEGHVMWFPAGPLVTGVEYRRISTEYGGATGTLVANHVNLQAGFRF